MNYSNCILKTIGFFSNPYKNQDFIENGFNKIVVNDETINFLNKSYHSEYINLMFNNNPNEYGVTRMEKKIDVEIEIINIKKKVLINSITLFNFFDSFQKSQFSIFTVDYKVLSSNLNDLSDCIVSLKNPDSLIKLSSKEVSLDAFLQQSIMDENFIDETSDVSQYAGYKYKHYLVIDFDKEEYNRDDLLFELGTSSKINSIKNQDLDSPSPKYKNQVLENKISCFNNYECLTLLDSFTVIGRNNYNPKEIYNHNSWNDIYFSIYVFNLYVKASIQVISNSFSEDSVRKRKEFKEFYNKYYFVKISFNFLPNEIYKGISKSLEIEEDIDFIQERLETLAVQVNEKQQKQIGLILLVISVIALLETPLHIEGIRKIIGIDALVIYNSAVYFLLVFSVVIFLYQNLKK